MTGAVEGATRLMALVRVDMVGSTASLAARGVSAAVGDRRLLTDIVERSMASADARVVATEGDAAVVACSSTVTAVTVAAAIVTEAGSAPFEVRVGVTIDELAVTDGRPAGIDEQLARRLAAVEAGAAPGQVTVDDRARRVLLGTPGLGVERAGDVHRLTAAPTADDGPATELRAVLFSRIAAADHEAATDPSDDDGWSAVLARALDTSAALVTDHGGEIVDGNGPGHVVVFPGARSALAAAHAIHASLAAANLHIEAGPAATADLSVALGEVTVEGGDTYGRPVVEAARLLDHAVGATAISASVAAAAELDTADPATESLGPLALKGFEEATTVHRLPAAGAPALVGLSPVLARPTRFAFAGRGDDLAALRASWATVAEGGIAGVLVSGEEGSGKTRLTRELAHEVAAGGGIVLFGSADEDLTIPYATIGEALAPAAVLDPAIAAALGSDDGGVAGSVRPEAGPLSRVFGAASVARSVDGPGVGDHEIDRYELFADVEACLGRLARRRPVLLVVDDLQWAGADTIELLDHLLAGEAPRRVMVVGTVRSEHLGGDGPVNRLLDSPRIARRLVHRRLGRLDTAEVTTMLSSRNEAALDESSLDFVAEVARATGGSPLFVEELVVHLAATGVLAERDGNWGLAVAAEEITIPSTILDLMSHRLARLGDDANELLAVAAVIGPTFAVGVLAEVAERPLEAVVDVVDAAVAVRLLHDDGPGGGFGFADEITREAALRMLPPARRALVHRTVAELLATHRPEPIDALAYHWEAALGRDATERTVHYQRLAATRDMGAAAWESAIDRLRLVVKYLDELGEDDDRVRAEVHYDLGFSLRMIGDEAHGPDLVEAGDRARRLGDGHLLTRAAIAMMRPGAWYPEAAVVDDQISEMYEDALFLLDADDPARPRVLAGLATNLAYHPDADRRWELLREAQRTAAELGDRHLMAVADAAELIACQEPDLFDRRWSLACDVRRAGRALRDRDIAFTGGFFMLLEHIGRGEFDQAEKMAGELRELAEAGRAYWPRFLVAHFDSLTAVARCSPGAQEVIEAERAEFEDQPVDWFGISVIQQAVVAMGRGELADMLLPFAEALEQHSHNEEWARKWNYPIAKAYIDTDRPEQAVAAIEKYPDLDFDRYWLSSLHHLGQLGLMLGRADYCERVLAEMSPYRGRFAIIGVGAALSGQVSTALGQAALGLGRLDEAEELFREAMDQAVELGFPFFATLARRHLAMTLLRRDEASAEAREHLDEAAAVAVRHGLALEAAAVETLKAGLV
ncbi:MAG: AAA family ATPase [Actinomycetota bacterium]